MDCARLLDTLATDFARLREVATTADLDAPVPSCPGWTIADLTVGYWIRRMAQETVIHRVDAEISAGLEVTDIPDDLALDGIDADFLTDLRRVSTAGAQ